MNVVKGLVWLFVFSTAAYGGVIIAMLYGWGIKPVSWTWIIIGYMIATAAWPVIVAARRMIFGIKDFEEHP